MYKHECAQNRSGLGVVYDQEVDSGQLSSAGGIEIAHGWSLVIYDHDRYHQHTCHPITFCPWCGALLCSPDVWPPGDDD